eukprot:365559-Chlamydomonas_euryale.AAC.5
MRVGAFSRRLLPPGLHLHARRPASAWRLASIAALHMQPPCLSLLQPPVPVLLRPPCLPPPGFPFSVASSTRAVYLGCSVRPQGKFVARLSAGTGPPMWRCLCA